VKTIINIQMFKCPCSFQRYVEKQKAEGAEAKRST